REISFAITNIRGINIGIYTPDLAFEAVVKDQLANNLNKLFTDRFKEPTNVCIDLVTTELLKTVGDCCAIVKAYPRLRAIIERLVNEHIEKRQRKVKNKIKDRIKIESAYMNTAHEDFIGLTGATRLMAKKDIVETEGNNKMNDKMELIFKTKDEFNKLYEAFSKLGITVDKPEEKCPSKKGKNCEEGADFTNEVDLIRIQVESYLKIMKKNMKDYIPKLIMHHLVNNTREFLTIDLHASLLAYDEKELLMIDPEVEKQRKKLAVKYDSCKEALNVIRNISSESF
ncbi:dynamin-1-like protein, partial [Leptotrombidium deliense]